MASYYDKEHAIYWLIKYYGAHKMSYSKLILIIYECETNLTR